MLIIGLPIVSSILSVFIEREYIPKVSVSLILSAFILSFILLVFNTNGKFFLFLPDNLGLLLSTYILLVSLVVHKYSENYMSDEKGFRRFYALLGLITSSLLLLVLSDNLLLLLGSWHLMGIFLYLLLNQNSERREAFKSANYALFTHKLADIPLLIAVILLYKEYKTLSLSEIFEISQKSPSEILPLITFLIVLSGILKSAQIPFHHWLVYSMEGPTPVSALMHAGIVNAGAFLVNRFAPLFPHDVWGLQLAFIVGSFTAIFGSVLMLLQNDIKKALGYSTVGQMGYMIMELGVGAFALAVYHMMAHGIFKASLFLYSGSIIHSARKDPNIPEDEVYAFIKKEEKPTYRIPWIVYGALTIFVPLLLVVLIHYLVEEHFFEYETSLILLFFGWITAAQVVASSFRVERENPLRTAFLAILSLTVFLLGYAIIGHSLQNFLYPQKELVEKIYEVAFASPILFAIEVILMVLIILTGWIFIYYASKEKYLPFYESLYSLFFKEFYIPELYLYLKEKFLKASRILYGIDSKLKGSFLSVIPLIILAVVFPLFPISIFVSRVLYKYGIPLYVSLPLIGFIFSFYVDFRSEFLSFLASLTFLIHSVRLFSVRNLRELSSEVYVSLFPIIWLSGFEPIYVIFLAVSPLLLFLLSDYLRKNFFTDNFDFLRGFILRMPLFSFVFISTVLYTVSAMFPVFKVIFNSLLETNFINVLLVSLAWLLISLALFTNSGRILFGKVDEDTFYTDIDLKRFILLTLSLSLFTLAGGVL